jgi:hypothetical protein
MAPANRIRGSHRSVTRGASSGNVTETNLLAQRDCVFCCSCPPLVGWQDWPDFVIAGHFAEHLPKSPLLFRLTFFAATPGMARKLAYACRHLRGGAAHLFFASPSHVVLHKTL